LTVVLVIVGVIAVFAIGLLLGNLLTQDEPTPPPVTMQTPMPGAPYAVARDYVNIRTGPGLDYPIYGIATPGSSSEIVGRSEDGGWWVVKLPTSIVGAGQGWVSADYVDAHGAENVPVVPTPPLDVIDIPAPSEGAPTAVALTAINVRSGPSTDYTSYGVAPEGTHFEVIGKNDAADWWLVRVNIPEGQGWVSGDYVSVSNADGVPVVPAP